MSHAGRFILAAASVIWLSWACGSSTSGDGPGNGAEAGEMEVTPSEARLGFTESLTLVTLVDLLFLGFAAIQLAFLFGEAQYPVNQGVIGFGRTGAAAQ